MESGLIWVLFLLILNKTKENKALDIPVDNMMDTKQEMDVEKTINLNIPYTAEKVRIMKKIGPYFPEEFLPVLNKSLVITEKIVKLYETIEFIQIPDANYIKEVIPVENNKDRLSYILNTIQKEVSREEIKNMGMAMDIILNIDKYKKMFNVLHSLMANPDTLNDPNKIFSLIEPFIQGKDEKEKEKLKDMAKMFEIMKTLDTPKKSKENDTKSKED